MPEQREYKGRPCYIRSAVYVEYLDALKPDNEMFILIDETEQIKTLFANIIDVSCNDL